MLKFRYLVNLPNHYVTIKRLLFLLHNDVSLHRAFSHLAITLFKGNLTSSTLSVFVTSFHRNLSLKRPLSHPISKRETKAPERGPGKLFNIVSKRTFSKYPEQVF